MPEITLEDIRLLLREELARAWIGLTIASTPLTMDLPGEQCPATKGALVCVKLLHRGRHTFRPRPHEAPPSKWRELEFLALPSSGRRHYTVRPGSPCKVLGFGKRTEANPDGAAQPGWTITKIEQSMLDPTDINVTVDRRGSHTRTVKSDRIVYVRPRG